MVVEEAVVVVVVVAEVVVAVVVIDDAVGEPPDAPNTRKREQWEVGSDDEADGVLAKKRTQYDRVVASLLHAMESDERITIQRKGIVPRAVHVKGCRLDIDNLLPSSALESARVCFVYLLVV